ncbi:hypothetical protein N7532_008571 [Penicillium argentinense]|uniref:Zn(2)-C6 fungal-type domain-containing protein n=1 Tax=Penicillium argentinense TaxID=1131581 RepID=A0A9W9EXN4_9EURO|nr:uncharacterized protein N7532_008571 [Penicillium argentinense]KAJ5089887.1 hypothetical protein N7532_008571 [Penicillium argentinense]
MSPKRACDICISRKVKCSGSWPCDTCREALTRVPCTYLKPPRKRGPKVRRVARQDQDVDQIPIPPGAQRNEESVQPGPQGLNVPQRVASDDGAPATISKMVLAPVVRLYQQYSYSVWPVINVDRLLDKIEDINPQTTEHDAGNLACLITALCAATMAQLQLAPMQDGSTEVDSSVMAQTCLRMRRHCNGSDREYFDFWGILTSFFLHVYHAKVNQRSVAMMYIQEAIAAAKMIRLDNASRRTDKIKGLYDDFITNKALIFPLLWVSERGYAMHLGRTPSCIDPPPLTDLKDSPTDLHVQGLLDLVMLFIAFDQISVRGKSQNEITSATHLTDTENKLSSLRLNIAGHVSTRTADCHITREWMRTILWQEALSMGLLSSATSTDIMTFGFPAQVSRDLLHALRFFSETDLLPLGRDQLLKCFEVANSLADTVLLTASSHHSSFQHAPQDFLHALYQKLSPFLEQDPILNSILRTKTAEVLVMAPARLLTLEPGGVHINGRIGQGTIEYVPYSDTPDEDDHSNPIVGSGSPQLMLSANGYSRHLSDFR